MGATNFRTTVEIENGSIADTFHKAVEQARHEYGHGGYTGTIAEKHGYKLIKTLYDATDDELNKIEKAAFDAIEKDGCLIDDDDLPATKWGPAAAIVYMRNGKKLVRFFGWASC